MILMTHGMYKFRSKILLVETRCPISTSLQNLRLLLLHVFIMRAKRKACIHKVRVGCASALHDSLTSWGVSASSYPHDGLPRCVELARNLRNRHAFGDQPENVAFLRIRQR